MVKTLVAVKADQPLNKHAPWELRDSVTGQPLHDDKYGARGRFAFFTSKKQAEHWARTHGFAIIPEWSNTGLVRLAEAALFKWKKSVDAAPTMKPFDLAAFRAGTPAVTRDGRNVTFIGYAPATFVPLIVHVEGAAVVTMRFDDGKIYSAGVDHPGDFFMKPTTVVRWLNVAKPNSASTPGMSYEHATEKEAKDAAASFPQGYRIIAQRVEFDE